jgi:hypothetical protein
MKFNRQRFRTSAGLVLAAGALLAGAPAAGATALYGITSGGKLATFPSNNPGNVDRTELRGLPDGVKLVGIDEQPASGNLYGIGDNSTVYTIAPNGVVVPVGDGFDNLQVMPPSSGVALDGKFFAVDFNPVPNAIRIVSNTGQNLRVSPTTGDLVAEDAEISGANAQIVSGAYTNSQQSAMAPAEATLYVLDARGDRIYTQNPPNDGVLTKPVNLDFNLQRRSGFDLVGSGSRGFIANTTRKATKLYKVTGESKIGLDGDTEKVGRVGAKLTALAVNQPTAN